MHKLNQYGLARNVALLVLFAAVLVGIIGYAVYNAREGGDTTSGQSNAIAPGDAVLRGTVAYLTQGPTDEVTGEQPTSATLAIGTEAAFQKWHEQAQKIAHEGTGEKPLTKATKPGSIDIKNTATGLVSERISDAKGMVVCIVRPEAVDYGAGSVDQYTLTTCKQLVKTGEIEVKLRLIGFGSNSIECEASACKDVVLGQ